MLRAGMLPAANLEPQDTRTHPARAAPHTNNPATILPPNTPQCPTRPLYHPGI